MIPWRSRLGVKTRYDTIGYRVLTRHKVRTPATDYCHSGYYIYDDLLPIAIYVLHIGTIQLLPLPHIVQRYSILDELAR